VTVFCPSQVSSYGCVPRIGFQGCPSAQATSGFVVHCKRLAGQKLGVLLYDVTGQPTAKSFQGGVLCVRQPIFRTPARSTGGLNINGCTGGLRIDMNAFASGAIGGLPMPQLAQPGTTVACQWWVRDPHSPWSSILSNALRYVVAP
jgi:hypothetical protein